MQQTGTITFLGKGFGFIKVEGREKDLFFHARALVGVLFDDLKVGDTLSYENLETGNKGTSAVGVRKA